MTQPRILFSLILSCLSAAMGGKTIVGFDCNFGESAYQEVSLLGVKKCQNLSWQYEDPIASKTQIIQRVAFEAIDYELQGASDV